MVSVNILAERQCLYNLIQVNQRQQLYNKKRVHKYDQNLMFKQHWQTMLNKCCLNGPVPTGNLASPTIRNVDYPESGVAHYGEPSMEEIGYLDGIIRQAISKADGRLTDCWKFNIIGGGLYVQ